MIGVILAAGMAKRLRPLTDTKPKCLLPVAGRTLLERTVDAMHQAGITEFVVVTGYRANMIRDFLTDRYLTPAADDAPSPITIHFIDNPDYANNNNIFSLWLTRPFTDGHDFLLMDSDILCDPAIIPAVLSVDGSALALNRHELGDEEMKVVADGDGRIVEISKTCRPEDAAGESVGIEHMTADYSSALFRELQQMIEHEGLIDIFYERAFERLIPQGHTFEVVDTTDLFGYELDTPEDLEKASAALPKELY